MKYLRTYKLFESVNDESLVKDILADIIDDGFIVQTSENDYVVSVYIMKIDEDEEYHGSPSDYYEEVGFKYSDVEPNVNELISQMSDRYPKSKILISPVIAGDDGSSFTIDEFIEEYSKEDLDNISQVQIGFNKTPPKYYKMSESNTNLFGNKVADVLADIFDKYNILYINNSNSDGILPSRFYRDSGNYYKFDSSLVSIIIHLTEYEKETAMQVYSDILSMKKMIENITGDIVVIKRSEVADKFLIYIRKYRHI